MTGGSCLVVYADRTLNHSDVILFKLGPDCQYNDLDTCWNLGSAQADGGCEFLDEMDKVLEGDPSAAAGNVMCRNPNWRADMEDQARMSAAGVSAETSTVQSQGPRYLAIKEEKVPFVNKNLMADIAAAIGTATGVAGISASAELHVYPDEDGETDANKGYRDVVVETTADCNDVLAAFAARDHAIVIFTCECRGDGTECLLRAESQQECGLAAIHINAFDEVSKVQEGSRARNFWVFAVIICFAIYGCCWARTPEAHTSACCCCTEIKADNPGRNPYFIIAGGCWTLAEEEAGSCVDECNPTDQCLTVAGCCVAKATKAVEQTDAYKRYKAFERESNSYANEAYRLAYALQAHLVLGFVNFRTARFTVTGKWGSATDPTNCWVWDDDYKVGFIAGKYFCNYGYIANIWMICVAVFLLFFIYKMRLIYKRDLWKGLGGDGKFSFEQTKHTIKLDIATLFFCDLPLVALYVVYTINVNPDIMKDIFVFINLIVETLFACTLLKRICKVRSRQELGCCLGDAPGKPQQQQQKQHQQARAQQRSMVNAAFEYPEPGTPYGAPAGPRATNGTRPSTRQPSSIKQNSASGAHKTVSVPCPLGISFVMNDRGENVITNVKPGGNAEATGQLSAGMQIVTVNRKPVRGLSKKDVASLIRSSPGSCLLGVSNNNVNQSTSQARAGRTPPAPAAATAKKRASTKRKKPRTKSGKSSNPTTQFAVGDTVTVDGYDGKGIVRFVGPHNETGKLRCGVELDNYGGKNNGSVRGHAYFSCPNGKGVLVDPSKLAAAIADIVIKLEPTPMPESEQKSALHVWLDTLKPGFGDQYAAILEGLGIENPEDLDDPDVIDEDFFDELDDEGVDEDAIQAIKLAVGYESEESDDE